MKNSLKMFGFVSSVFFLVIPVVLCAEDEDLKLLDWKPISQLVVKETRVLKPKFPVIDFHNHLGRTFGEFSLEQTKKYLMRWIKPG